MDQNLFAQIESVNKKLQNPIAIPQLISKYDTSTGSSSSSSSSTSSSSTSSSSTSSKSIAQSYNVPSISYSSSYLPSSLSVSTKEDYPFCLAITSADAITDNSSMFGTTFIEYTILIVRNSDGESKVVKKRYKDLLQYYQQLVSNEIITNHDDISFPERNSFAPADPNTPFIKKRMIDLQMFFQKLFNQNPQLYFLPLTIEFFEIENIVLNTPINSSIKEREKEKFNSQDQSNNMKAPPSYSSSNYSNTSIFCSITTFNNTFERKNVPTSTESKSKYDL